jgi:hypothetical protein
LLFCGDHGRFFAEDLPVIPDLFIERVVLPPPRDVTGVVVLVGDRPVPGDGCPQAGQVDAFDGPEIDEAALFDESSMPGLGRQVFWTEAG